VTPRAANGGPPVPVPVLCYHSVSERAHPGHETWTLAPRAFGEHVAALRDAGRTPLLVTDLAECLRGRRPLPERPVAITFDDGYANTLPAAEELAAAGLSSTAFVTSGFVGEPDMLSPAQVRELAGLPGVELGAHSVSHPRLDELGARDLEREVVDCRARLEELSGRPVTSFAYPHGFHGARVRTAVVTAGYRAAAAVKNAVSHSRDDPYAIARWLVTADSSARRVEDFLAGTGFPAAWSSERLSTRGFRAYRRARRLAGRGRA
jgi:peptidoglycan/xylan/chitin deacetylase (PgdA/CDA1 family)